MAEFSASLEQFNGVSREEKMKQLEKWWVELKEEKPDFDASAWPKYDREQLQACIGRNVLASMIVLDPQKQAMMGKYKHSEEVIEVCEMITGKGDP